MPKNPTNQPFSGNGVPIEVLWRGHKAEKKDRNGGSDFDPIFTDFSGEKGSEDPWGSSANRTRFAS